MPPRGLPRRNTTGPSGPRSTTPDYAVVAGRFHQLLEVVYRDIEELLALINDVQIDFCDPKSPWQRGSYENTNGLLRQYLPKSADRSQCTHRELDAIARSFNTRPRQTLGWMTPSQAFANAVPITT